MSEHSAGKEKKEVSVQKTSRYLRNWNMGVRDGLSLLGVEKARQK